MKTPSNFYRDIVTGFLFILGIFGFMSGEFVVSTFLFGFASVSSNMNFESATKA